MVVDDNIMSKYLYHGYTFSIIRCLKFIGVENKEEALIVIKRLVLLNIRSFMINPNRGFNNKINTSIKDVINHFEKISI